MYSIFSYISLSIKLPLILRYIIDVGEPNKASP